MRPAVVSEQARQRRLHGLAGELADANSVMEVADILRDLGSIVLGAYRTRLWTVERRGARLVDRERRMAIELDHPTHPIAHVIQSGEPLWLPRCRHEALATDPDEPTRAACVLPLVADGVVVGAIDLAYSTDPAFFPEDREFLMSVARFTALAVDRNRLPVVEEWPTGSARIETIAMPTLRVLVIDDAENARSLVQALESMGHEVVLVFNGFAALRAAEEWDAHVAFIDLDLPTTDGCEVASRLRDMPGWEGTRFVAVTAAARARYVGFDSHVLKPFTIDTAAALLPVDVEN